MIRIRVHAGKDAEQRVHELCDALQNARIWKMSDRRCTRNLKLNHSSGTVKGIIRRVRSDEAEYLNFRCTARDRTQAAITAGRFVNLVLRDIPTVMEISIQRT